MLALSALLIGVEWHEDGSFQRAAAGCPMYLASKADRHSLVTLIHQPGSLEGIESGRLG